jgi:AraC-like DNA-binding protein
VWQWFACGDCVGPKKWSGRTLARRLGISHTYVQKLLREFKADLVKACREQQRIAWVTIWDLDEAQKQTEQERMQGYLRWPRLWTTVEYRIGSNVVRAVVKTKAAEARAAEAALPPAQRKVVYGEHEQRWANGRFRPDFAVPPEYLPSPQYSPVPFGRRILRRRWRPGQIGWGRWPGGRPRFR